MNSITDKTKMPAMWAISALALAKFLLHMIINATVAYGYFRDEFYYIACSDHLAWGYVDQPPFSLFMLKLSRFVLGDSLVALRVLPALCGAAVIFVTGLLVRRLGGNTFAIVLAGLSLFIAPIYLAMNGFYSMNAFDQLFWVVSFYLLVLIIQQPDQKYWLWLGIVLGLGLLNKISILWLGAGILAGLLLTPRRKLLLTRGPWLSAGIALIFFLPHIIWQIANGWPTLEFMHNAMTYKYAERSMLDFLGGQVLMMHPFTFLVWLPGLYYFLLHPKGRRFKLLGIIYVTILIILILNKTSKTEYLSPAYPVLLAGGAVLISTWLKRNTWLKTTFLILLLAGGILTMPLALPVLPVERYIAYADMLGQAPSSSEKNEVGKLPQFYADMFGWENMAREVSEVYQGLSPEEQARCVFFGQNYGQAGAIRFYSSRYPLPRAISGHNNFWLWGPGEIAPGAPFIILGGSIEDHQEIFQQVAQKGFVQSEYAMPYENNLPVFVAREAKGDIVEYWPELKHYN